MLNYHATFTKGTIEFRLFQFDRPENGKKKRLTRRAIEKLHSALLGTFGTCKGAANGKSKTAAARESEIRYANMVDSVGTGWR